MIAIRLDANKDIATGHLMRCLVIACKLRDLGEACIFITADKFSEQMLDNYGFESICLHSEYNRMENELAALCETIKKLSIQKLLIDSYFVTPMYLSVLNQLCKLIYIDDLHDFDYPVHLLINYNVYAEELAYKQNGQKMLLGPAYAPLREQFQNIALMQRTEVKKILILAGGADTLNITGNLLEVTPYDEFEGIEFHVVAGILNPHYEMLCKIMRKNAAITIHKNVSDMASLMCDCDIAISAASSTVYELCACAVPTVCFAFADNQLLMAKCLGENGIMIYSGDYRQSAQACFDRILDGIRIYKSNKELRKEISSKMKSIADGKGGERIAREILEL